MRNAGKPDLATLDNNDGMNSDAGAIVQSGQAIQQVRTQYSGAITVQKPRNRKELLASSLEEARLCGPDFYYRWTVNTKDGPAIVQGVSIDGAMILARNFGNCGVPVQLNVDAPGHWVLEATFVDLETGFNVTRLFRQRKGQTAGKKMDSDRSQDIAFQIGQSKAQRNVIVKALPIWLLQPCFEAAQAVEEEKYKDVAVHAPKALAAWGKNHGITQEQLEKKIGRKVAAWTPRDLAVLAAIYRGIKEGSTTLENEFAGEGPAEPEAQPAETAAAAAAVKPEEQDATYEDVPAAGNKGS